MVTVAVEGGKVWRKLPDSEKSKYFRMALSAPKRHTAKKSKGGKAENGGKRRRRSAAKSAKKTTGSRRRRRRRH